MIWHRLVTDFWPPDQSSIGPNLIASGIAFWAGWMWKGRRIVHHLTTLHEKHDRLAQAHEELAATQDAHGELLERVARDHGDQLAKVLDAVHTPPPAPPTIRPFPSEAS